MSMIYGNENPWSLEEIEQFPYLGHTVSRWRKRHIDLYAHPSDATMLISVGRSWNTQQTVIATEPRSAWATALDYIAHGRVYVSE
jgi:hypothetical protein